MCDLFVDQFCEALEKVLYYLPFLLIVNIRLVSSLGVILGPYLIWLSSLLLDELRFRIFFNFLYGLVFTEIPQK